MSDGLDAGVIERRIREYEVFGIHRTGWPGDDASAAWMRDILRAARIESKFESFDFPRFEYRRARLRWPEGSAEGVPFYDGGFTPPGGIEGDLIETDDEDLFGNIVVASENDPGFTQATLPERIEVLQEAGASGLVLVRADPGGYVTTFNAERIEHPYSLPVLQVGLNEARTLSSAVYLGVEAKLEIDGERLKSRARNVVATLPGTDPEAAPIDIMTPRSGWFTCASERGGGIAILLGIAEALTTRRDRRRTVHLVASSGHELHHLGLQAYLKARPGLEAQAHAWLHLGANIGTATGPVFIESNDDALRSQAQRAFERVGVERFEVIDRKGGEARNIDEAGGRYVSLRGQNKYFHSPQDTFDRASDAALAAAAGRAALAVVEEWLD